MAADSHYAKTKISSGQKSFDIIYTSLIRPILEYADVVWCNLTKYEEDELEKIQIEAARIVIGATKLVSHDNLYRETCWETLNSRRKQNKLTLYYKMINFLTPTYLSSLVPPRVGDMSSYSLRKSDQYQTIDTKSQLYYNSFLPSAVREWNALDSESQSCPSVTSFKRSISNRQVVPNYYFTGSRIEQILHARPMTNCSCLNYTLFSKNIIQNKFCDCGEIEDTQHFLFHSARYTAQREIIIEEVQRHCVPTLDILLFGDMSLNSHTNCTIFEAIQKFITHS